MSHEDDKPKHSISLDSGIALENRTIDPHGHVDDPRERMAQDTAQVMAATGREPLIDLETSNNREFVPLLVRPQNELISVPRQLEEVAENVAAVIPVLALSLLGLTGAWWVGWAHWSLLWMPVLMAAIYAVVKRRLTSYNRSHMYYLHREAAKNPLTDGLTESTEWINHILDRAWLVAEPVISARVIEEANKALKERKPALLESLALTTFTLGSRAPALLGVRVYPEMPPNRIMLDLNLAFVPQQSSSAEDAITAVRRKNGFAGWDSKVILTARMGKGFVSFPIPVLVQRMTFVGRLTVQLELMPNVPFVKELRAEFGQMPIIDFVLKPLKAVDLKEVPGLGQFINLAIRQVLGSTCVAPNSITVNVADIIAAQLTTRGNSVGVLRVDILAAKTAISSARGLMQWSALEPYVRFWLNGQIHAETPQLPDARDEMDWGEGASCFLLVQSLDDPVYVELMASTESVYGSLSLTLDRFADEEARVPASEWHELISPGTGESRGQLNLRLHYYPIVVPPTQPVLLKGRPQAIEEHVPSSKSGILRLTVTGVKGLAARALASVHYEVGLARAGGVPCAPVTHAANYNPNQWVSVERRNTSTPIWDTTLELLVEDPAQDALTVVFRGRPRPASMGVSGLSGATSLFSISRLLQDDPVLAKLTWPVADFLRSAPGSEGAWLELENGEVGAKMHVRFEWKPLTVKLPLSALSQDTLTAIPIRGVYRLHVACAENLLTAADEAENLDEEEKRSFYARILQNGRLVTTSPAYPSEKQAVWWLATSFGFVRREHVADEELTVEVWASKGPLKVLGGILGHGAHVADVLVGTAQLQIIETGPTAWHEAPLVSDDPGQHPKIRYQLQYFPCNDKANVAGDGVLTIGSLLSRGFSVGRKSRVTCTIGLLREGEYNGDENDDSLPSTVFSTKSLADGTCAWGPSNRFEAVVNRREVSHVTLTIKEHKAVQGISTIATLKWTVDELLTLLHSDVAVVKVKPGCTITLGTLQWQPLEGTLPLDPYDAGYLTVDLIKTSASDADGQIVKLNGEEVFSSKKKATWPVSTSRISVFRAGPKHRALLAVDLLRRSNEQQLASTCYFDLKNLSPEQEHIRDCRLDDPFEDTTAGFETVSLKLHYILDASLMAEMRNQRRNALMQGLGLVGSGIGAAFTGAEAITGGVFTGAEALTGGVLTGAGFVGSGISSGAGFVGSGISSGAGFFGSGISSAFKGVKNLATGGQNEEVPHENAIVEEKPKKSFTGGFFGKILGKSKSSKSSSEASSDEHELAH